MSALSVVRAGMVAFTTLSLGLAASAAAQGTPDNVVTTLQGAAKVQRASVTDNASQDLRFKDLVYLRDRITTADQSLVRILMGGTAVVTVRERSSLTITETPGTGVSTIDMQSGKLALAVAKDRMRPGQRIDIKTPNAVAGVRGTIVITEVSGTGSATDQGGGVNTRFTVLTGVLEVALLDPRTGQPGATRYTLNPLQTVSITGFIPPQGPSDITPAQAQAAASDYRVNLKDAPRGTNAAVIQKLVEQASSEAAATSGIGDAGGITIINRTNNERPGADPKGLLPPNCTNNCTPPPILPPPPPQCGQFCEGTGLGLLGRPARAPAAAR